MNAFPCHDISPAGEGENNPGRKSLLPGQFLVFSLAGRSFGIPFRRLAEVRTLETAMPVLFAPDYGNGFVTLNARRIQVLDLRVNFGMTATFDQATRLIVAFRQRPGMDDELFGLIVDRIDEVVTLDVTDLGPVPDLGPGVETDFILGTMPCPQGSRLLLNIDRLAG